MSKSKIITKNKSISKNAVISKTAKIKSNSLKLGDNVIISDNVELIGDKIVIDEGSIIGSKTKIHSKLIKIGKNSRISENCDIFVIESFALGNRSDLCMCEIRGRNVKIGNDFFSSTSKGQLLLVGGGNSFFPTSNLAVGDRCTIHDVSINIAMPVKIGNDVGVSHGTKFYTHYFWNSIFEGYPQKFAGISISDSCIIGAESFFLPGVTIGKDCVIGARSVVTKSFPASSVIVGNPARNVKRNYRKKISVEKHMELLKSTLKWYTEILQTKGYTIKKVDSLTYRVTDNNKNSIIILYSSNPVYVKKYRKAIVLTFKDLVAPASFTVLNLSKRTLIGSENELTDDLRDFLRKVGIRIFTNRRFRSIQPVLDY